MTYGPRTPTCARDAIRIYSHLGELMTPQREITVPELAQCLGCSIPHAQSLIRTGRIPGRKGPRGWVTTQKAVDEYIAQRRNGPLPRKVSAR